MCSASDCYAAFGGAREIGAGMGRSVQAAGIGQARDLPLQDDGGRKGSSCSGGSDSCCPDLPYYPPDGPCDGIGVIIDSPCPASPGGPVPDAVPTSGFQNAILAFDSVSSPASQISGLPITCVESGVTQISGCSQVIFFWPVAGPSVNLTFTTPGGAGTRCVAPLTGHNYSGGSVTSHGMGQLQIHVTQV